uniref:Uncharacterized protein n=1 Tax=Anguilla anguilla TaxID=7936 RepID=A0A0E9V398_ANGAN
MPSPFPYRYINKPIITHPYFSKWYKYKIKCSSN